MWTWPILPAVVVAVAGGASRGGASEHFALARVYGAGVHAYFSGDFLRSYDDLTAAIEGGSKDPRVLYFRGLAALRLGRLDEAEADFSKGADIEALSPGGWPVSRALERVQGNERLQLERHRARARVVALAEGRAAADARRSKTRASQSEVLRGRRPAAMPAPADDLNPFSDQPAADQPAAETLPPMSPVAPEPGPETEPGGAAEPAGNPAVEEPADEPAGGQPPAGGDEPPPEMELPPTAPPAAGSAKPATESAGSEDPFGDDPPPSAPDEPAAEEGAAAGQ